MEIYNFVVVKLYLFAEIESRKLESQKINISQNSIKP